MDELNNGLQAQTNEMRILLEQAGDVAGKRAAGIIDDAERIELEARRMACLTVIARNDAGELVSEAEFEAILEEKREQAALPTQEEQNAADIAYLMMTGGEWDV